MQAYKQELVCCQVVVDQIVADQVVIKRSKLYKGTVTVLLDVSQLLSPPNVKVVMGSNPIEDSNCFFVPCLSCWLIHL